MASASGRRHQQGDGEAPAGACCDAASWQADAISMRPGDADTSGKGPPRSAAKIRRELPPMAATNKCLAEPVFDGCITNL